MASIQTENTQLQHDRLRKKEFDNKDRYQQLSSDLVDGFTGSRLENSDKLVTVQNF